MHFFIADQRPGRPEFETSIFIVSFSLYSLTAAKPDLSPRAHRMMPPFLLAKTDNTSVNRTSRTGG